MAITEEALLRSGFTAKDIRKLRNNSANYGSTMPMPPYDPENPPVLGFFMVGAYQEILGNMHNLFGDTASVDVYIFPDGTIETEQSDDGDTVADMLQYVQLDPTALLAKFRDQVKETDLDNALQAQFLEEFEAGLYGYTYLEDE